MEYRTQEKRQAIKNDKEDRQNESTNAGKQAREGDRQTYIHKAIKKERNQDRGTTERENERKQATTT